MLFPKAEHGEEYYFENKVVYISVDVCLGRAIVQGSKAYEVEFNYDNGEISALICSCYCGGVCKHDFAAMLQLRETMKIISENYSRQFSDSNYFAAVTKPVLFSFAVDIKTNGSFILG